ncbi:MAG TPA: sporulation protein YunB [Clostridiales bacterium]|nr:sporulation protein YunB [Clostridiales bacterium]
MRLGLSRTRNRSLKGVGIFFTLFFLIFLIWLIFTKLQPSFIEYAKVYSNNIANEVVNSAVDDVFVKEEYQSLAQIMENSSENIKAIETDTAKINRLKSAIIQSMQKNIDSHKSDTVYVPLGSCSNLYFLAGLGPKVPIRIYPVSIVNADFKESFDSVGINQVKHKLYLDVSMKMSFVGMMFAQADTVETSVLLNETIIVGDTPTYYGNVGMTASVE